MSITKYHDEMFELEDVRTGLTGEAIAFARACVYETGGELKKTTADTDLALGLAYDEYADATRDAQYITRGHLRFVATGDIAISDPLCPDDGTAGNIRTAVSGDRVIGYATTTAATTEYCYGNFDFISSHLLA